MWDGGYKINVPPMAEPNPPSTRPTKKPESQLAKFITTTGKPGAAEQRDLEENTTSTTLSPQFIKVAVVNFLKNF